MLKQLDKIKGGSAPEGPLLLIIMDGVGIGPDYPGNAVHAADTPRLDALFERYPYTTLQAHGPAVGLPADDDMGNSEVGHNAMGAGQIFAQGAKLVHQAIEDERLFEGPLWRKLMRKHRESGTLHFIGLFSDGNVHSHINHCYAMLEKAVAEGIRRVRLHVLLDGRDVYEKSALSYIRPLEHKLLAISNEFGFDYRIASGGGRMNVTMDRYEADWSIVERGYDAHVRGSGRQFPSATAALETYYREDETMTDQYMDSFVVAEEGRPVGTIEDGDSVVFFNFRGDRAIEFSRAMTEEHFTEFERGPLPDILFAGMMEYDGDRHIPKHYLVNPPSIEKTIGQYLCASGVTSFAISETQKFGHVTYFWNGNNSGYIDETLETYVEIPSDKIQFDRAPEMKATEITEQALRMLDEGFDFGRINFANGDMVGHTGNLPAAVTAVETVDACVGRLVDHVLANNGTVIITADHGNADEMFTEKNGQRVPKTSHTLNPVPFCIVSAAEHPSWRLAALRAPGLANITATVLNLLGFEAPDEYEQSLIVFDSKQR